MIATSEIQHPKTFTSKNLFFQKHRITAAAACCSAVVAAVFAANLWAAALAAFSTAAHYLLEPGLPVLGLLELGLPKVDQIVASVPPPELRLPAEAAGIPAA